jgi:hypothetical protein
MNQDISPLIWNDDLLVDIKTFVEGKERQNPRDFTPAFFEDDELGRSFYSFPNPFLILSCPILSYPVLSCPILSYPILSYPILFFSSVTLVVGLDNISVRQVQAQTFAEQLTLFHEVHWNNINHLDFIKSVRNDKVSTED